jgi:hypothetical protein
MLDSNNEFEKYLSDFQPRGVRPLEIAQTSPNVWLKRLAAAATVVISASALWIAGHTENKTIPKPEVSASNSLPQTDSTPNSIALTKMALEDPQQFEQVMDAASRNILPDLRGPQSTLRVLAKP